MYQATVTETYMYESFCVVHLLKNNIKTIRMNEIVKDLSYRLNPYCEVLSPPSTLSSAARCHFHKNDRVLLENTPTCFVAAPCFLFLNSGNLFTTWV